MDGGYEAQYSTDDESYETVGKFSWKGKGPHHFGLIAKNGGVRGLKELDARFDFFDLRWGEPK